MGNKYYNAKFNDAPYPKGANKQAHSPAHPGFKAVEAKIGREKGIRNPGAVLAAAARKASPAAVKANPRLARVSGVRKPR